MTTADTIERPRTDGTETEVLDRLQAIYARKRADEWRTTTEKLVALRQSFTEQRNQVLSPQLRERITRTIRDEAKKDPRGPGLRCRSLIEARKAGVEMGVLKGLHERVYGNVGEAIKGPGAFHYHESVVGSLADSLELPPFDIIAPDPDKEQLFARPFVSCWDRIAENVATGDGVIVENSSYLDCNGRMGSKLVARNHDAGDVDLLCAYRENGYLIPFTMLRTGILQVKADLSALICHHHVSTDDEWGWSDFHAITRGRLVMAAFWNWEDVNPANEVSHQSFVVGLDCSGDGESFPGTSIQAFPGERRIINLFSEMAFPEGQQIWIYVGVADKIWAFLNDVGIDISLDSAWLLNSLAVRSI